MRSTACLIMAPMQESVARVAFSGSDSNHLSRICMFDWLIISSIESCKIVQTTVKMKKGEQILKLINI